MSLVFRLKKTVLSLLFFVFLSAAFVHAESYPGPGTIAVTPQPTSQPAVQVVQVTSQSVQVQVTPPPSVRTTTVIRGLDTKCPNIGIPPIQVVPTALNLTFPAEEDQAGPAAIKANCGNGETITASCTRGSCTVSCGYPTQASCSNGVCLVRIFSCGGTCTTDSQTGTTTCTRNLCEIGSDAFWQQCVSGSIQLKERPKGCAYNNPACQPGETCRYNQCVRKECETDADCGPTDACKTAVCSDYKCQRTQTQGCPLQTACLPFGSRQSQNGTAQYCETSGELSAQKEAGHFCQNNYECKTNFCSNGTCLDIAGQVEKQKGVIDQILAFLRSLFGMT